MRTLFYVQIFIPSYETKVDDDKALSDYAKSCEGNR